MLLIWQQESRGAPISTNGPPAPMMHWLALCLIYSTRAVLLLRSPSNGFFGDPLYLEFWTLLFALFWTHSAVAPAVASVVLTFTHLSRLHQETLQNTD